VDIFWENTPVHPSRQVEPFMAQQKNSSFFTNHLSLLDLAQADYFHFLKMKRELAASPCPPGQGQEEVGGGHQHSDQRLLPKGAQDVAVGLGKVCSYWQWIYKRKLEKTFFDTFYRFRFICTLSLNSPRRFYTHRIRT
jgi:hypothetical protein